MHQTRPPFLELDLCRLVQLVWRGSLSDNSNKAPVWAQGPIEEQVEQNLFLKSGLQFGSRIVLGIIVFLSWDFLISCFVRFPCYLQHFGAESCHFNGICNISEFEPWCLQGFGTPTVHVAWYFATTSRVH